jgi:hypothetical protein
VQDRLIRIIHRSGRRERGERPERLALYFISALSASSAVQMDCSELPDNRIQNHCNFFGYAQSNQAKMSTIPPSSATLPLEYAPAPPRWRRPARRIVLGLIVLATTVCCWRWGPHAWHQSQLLYWQRQCLNFSASTGTVVYEEEPTAATVLLRDPKYSLYVLHREPGGPNNHPTTVQSAVVYPRCLHALDALTTSPMIPPASIFNWVGPGAILYLHERISPAGHRRLVCVNYAPDADNFRSDFMQDCNTDTCVASPATWTRPFTLVPQVYFDDILTWFPRRPPLVRIFAGQTDPNDPAHFTIRYQMWGQEDVADGRLQDDDQVAITQRHPPEKLTK